MKVSPQKQEEMSVPGQAGPIPPPAGYAGPPGPPMGAPAAPTFTHSSSSDAEGGCCVFILKFLCIIIMIITMPFSLFMSFRIVAEYERAVIMRLGRALPGAKGPGLFFIYPCLDDLIKVDLRTVAFDIPPQEVLTRDSVTIAVDGVVYYKVFSPYVAIVNVQSYAVSTRLLAQTTLRNILGTKNLAEVLGEREVISDAMQRILDEGTDPWGIKVERVEIKDVRLPAQLQRAMAAEAEASREARAKVIAAKGEQEASEALRAASDVISESSSALQLRYLQTLSAIAAERNSTIVFPLPIDMMAAFMDRTKQ